MASNLNLLFIFLFVNNLLDIEIMFELNLKQV
jgi:hypothetical protein